MSNTTRRHKKHNRKKKLRKQKKSLTKGEDSLKTESMKEFKRFCKVEKVDTELGLVFGWGIICTKNEDMYVDHGNDTIPEHRMLESVFDFTKNIAILDDMHDEEDHGSVVFSMPLTSDIAKAFGLVTDKTGWMVGVKPDPDVFAKFESGEYTGFSIGGVLHDYAMVETE